MPNGTATKDPDMAALEAAFGVNGASDSAQGKDPDMAALEAAFGVSSSKKPAPIKTPPPFDFSNVTSQPGRGQITPPIETTLHPDNRFVDTSKTPLSVFTNQPLEPGMRTQEEIAKTGTISAQPQTTTRRMAPGPGGGVPIEITPQGEQALERTILPGLNVNAGPNEPILNPKAPLLGSPFTPEDTRQHPIVAGILNTLSGFTSPENIALIGATQGLGALATGSQLFPRIASAGFASMMAKNLYDQVPAFKQAYDAGNIPEAQRIATEMILGAYFGGKAAQHALFGAGTPSGVNVVKQGEVAGLLPDNRSVFEVAADTAKRAAKNLGTRIATGQQPPKTVAAMPDEFLPESAQSPVELNRDTVAQLTKLGYTNQDISNLTADQLQKIVRGKLRKGAVNVGPENQQTQPQAEIKPAQNEQGAQEQPGSQTVPTTAQTTPTRAAQEGQPQRTVGAGEQLAPEKTETLKTQVDALANGTNPVVYFPKGTTSLPEPPENSQVTVVGGNKPGSGTYYHDDSVTPEQIKKAVADGTYGQLLGHIQTKQEAVAGSAQPTVVTARTPGGTEAKASVVDGTNAEAVQQQAETLRKQFPEAQVSTETPEQAIAARGAGDNSAEVVPQSPEEEAIDTPLPWESRRPKSLPRKPATPLTEQYSPEILENAHQELENAATLASTFERAGRYHADLSDLGVPARHLAQSGWYGVNSPARDISSMYPWFDEAQLTPGRLAKIATQGKGVEYDRVLGMIADRHTQMKAIAEEVVAPHRDELLKLASEVRSVDEGLAETLEVVANGKLYDVGDIKKFIQEKVHEAEAAAAFSRAFDSIVAEGPKAPKRSEATGTAEAGGARAAELPEGVQPVREHAEELREAEGGGARETTTGAEGAESPETAEGGRYAAGDTVTHTLPWGGRVDARVERSEMIGDREQLTLQRLDKRGKDVGKPYEMAAELVRKATPPEVQPAAEKKPSIPRTPPGAKGEAKQPAGVLPGMEKSVEEQKRAAAEYQGEKLTEEANRPGEDITSKTGEMEAKSPLFRGTEASPQREMFGSSPTEKKGSIIPTEKGAANGASESKSLGERSEGALEEVPPANVRGNGEGRHAERSLEPGGGANEGPTGESHRERNGAERSLGGSEGELPVSSEGRRPANTRTRSERAIARSGRSGFDYQIKVQDALGSGGERAKYAANVAAIKLVKQLEAEGRSATPEEQGQLVKYSGWGWSGNGLFNDYSYDWRRQREELRNLLSPEEYAAAKKSTINAHYTSPEVIAPIWSAVKQLGFDGGRILEPSAGVGHFFGLMPRDLWDNSTKTAVELDPISGKILKQLYQTVDTRIQGFEKLEVPDGFYDLAISNVPFGNISVNDPAYNKYHLPIHNYFILKMLDKVRPGGLLAAITSHYTLDAAKNEPARKLFADRADLIGAVRLPESAFKKNAGTDVTTDILFFKRRMPGAAPGGEAFVNPATVNTVEGESTEVNEYFAKHPEMVLGTHSMSGTMYRGRGQEYTVLPNSTEIGPQLATALGKLPKDAMEDRPVPESTTQQAVREALPDRGAVKPNGLTIKNGKVFRRVGNEMVEQTGFPKASYGRLKDMLRLRDTAREILDGELAGRDEKRISEDRSRLNNFYDDYVKTHGYLHEPRTVRAMADDPDLPFVLALEKWDSKTKQGRKTDMFTKQTVAPVKPIDHVDTAKDAMLATLAERGRLHMDRMVELTGKTPHEILNELQSQGLVFENPNGYLEPKDSYLSGNVRKKLAEAELASQHDDRFKENVEALKKVIPEDLPPGKIKARLGATWVPETDVRDFIAQRIAGLGNSDGVDIKHVASQGLWTVQANARAENSAGNRVKWGTNRISAIDLIEKALNLQIPTIYTPKDADGKTRVDEKETLAARAKLEEIQEEFGRWLWDHPERQPRLLRAYNDLFNSNVRWHPNGDHLTFPGMSAEWQAKIRPEQKAYVWRVIAGGRNTGAYHEVGLGKTLENIAAAMELRRLGLSNKPVAIVPNHMTEQWDADWRRFYPQANVLSISPDDFEASKRQEFASRIATGDWDGVVLAHSSFKKIPVRVETQRRYIQEQLDEVNGILGALKEVEGKKGPTVKQIEKAKARHEADLERLIKAEDKDNTVHFEDLGIDSMFVDEAHAYKSLPFFSKINRVSGLNANARSEMATDMYMKSRYLTNLNNGRGVYFLTGTPMKNSIAEAYIMMRYLDEAKLRELGIENFDSWAATFGKTEEQLEARPMSPDKFRRNRRFSKFQNLPEFSDAFSNSGDVKFINDVPAIQRPQMKTIVETIDRSPRTIDYMAELAHRGEHLPADPKIDNPLKITGEGRKLSVDYRLLFPDAPDEQDTRINRLVRNVVKEYEEGQAGKLTQLIFSDQGVPGDEGDFNVYQDIKNKLIARGIPADEIQFAQDFKGKEKRVELFDKVNDGTVRVLIASTPTLGVGANVQERMIANHHLDTPWTPADLNQRDGRVWRQGNINPEVRRYVYLTKDTFDTYMWQLQESKDNAFKSLLRGDKATREMDDIGDRSLSAAEIKALASGDPRIMQKIQLDHKVRELQMLSDAHQSQQANNRAALAVLPERIRAHQEYLDSLKKDIGAAKKEKSDEFTMRVAGGTYTERKDAGAALNGAVEKNRGRDPKNIGKFQGFDLVSDGSGNLYISGENRYNVSTNHENPAGTVQSIEATLRGLESRVPQREDAIEQTKKEMKDREAELGKDFPKQKELDEALAKQKELDDALDTSGRKDVNIAAAKEDSGEGVGEEGEEGRGEHNLPTKPRRNKNLGNESGAADFDLITLGIPRLIAKAWRAIAEGKARKGTSTAASGIPRTAPSTQETRPFERAGNIRLDKLNAPDDVIETIRQMAKDNQGFEEQRRGKIPFSATRDAAQKLVDDGMLTPDDLKSMKKGTALNAEELHAARSLMVQSAQEVREASKKVAQDPSTANVMAFESALLKHQGIQRAVAGATAEAGRALSQFRMVAEAMKATEQGKSAHERVLEALGDRELTEEAARALAAIPEDDLVGLNKFLRSQKQWTTPQFLEAYYTANILSGTRTPTKKGFGDITLALAETASKGIAGVIDPLVARMQGRPREHYAKEALVSAMAQVNAIPDAMRKAAFILSHGMDEDRLMNMEMPFRYEFKGGGKNPWNWPGRTLGAVTKLFQVTAFQGELHAQAYRQAMKEGRRGEAATNRATELLLNPTAKMIEQAAKQAQFQTYTEPPDTSLREMMNMRDKVRIPSGYPLAGGARPLRFVTPFLQIPYNIAKNALRYSPFGFAPASDANFRKTADFSKTLSRALVGTAVMGLMASLWFQKRLTGAPPSNSTKRDAWYREGNQPYSVRIGNRWVSYKGAGPFALTGAAVSALLDRAKENGKPTDALDIFHLAGAMGQALMDESFLHGLKGLTDMMQDPGHYAEKFFGGIIGGFVPMETALRQLNDALDGHVRDARTMSERIMAGLPVVSQSVREKLDALGRPIEKEGGKGLNSLVPGGTQKAEPKSDVDAELSRLEGLGLRNIGYAGKHLTIDNEKVNLTPDEQQEYQRVRGIYLQSYLRQTFASQEYKDATSQEKVEMAEEAIRQAAKDAHAMSGNQILADRLKRVRTASIPRTPPRASMARTQ